MRLTFLGTISPVETCPTLYAVEGGGHVVQGYRT
jgi:hypothetical protein